MTLSMKNFEQKEWKLYDSNLGQALESVEKGDLQCASECFKRIVPSIFIQVSSIFYTGTRS